MTLAPSPVALREYRTPKGASVLMAVREGTADHNNLYSCLNEDEYGLRDFTLDGWAVDIGAHIGGVTVGLAKDNPDARVMAVEALSANVELLRENVERNGLDHVTVVHAIAGRTTGTGTVRWNFGGGETADHHRFIGNAHDLPHETADSEQAAMISLADIVDYCDGHVQVMKIDCEGGEYQLLDSPAVKDVAEIRGEFHAGLAGIEALLGDTHVVHHTGGTEAFGAFRAVRR